MNRKNMLLTACMASVGLAVCVGSIAIAQPEKNAHGTAPAGQPEMKLPPGWTSEDMQACALAGTPGKMHEHLAKSAGVWAGKTTMWMGEGTEPMKADCTSTVTPMMDGKFFKCEMAGDFPGMGPFQGFGVNGFDNVSQKFVSTWIDNMGTGMMTGTGELSADGKTLTWTYSFNCPIQKKAVKMREVEHYTGPNTFTMEMFGPDPKTNKEYKMMSIEFTRKS